MWFYLSDCIAKNLRAPFLLRSMPPGPLIPKFKILDKTVSSQNMRDRLHTTDLPLATFLEEEGQASWVHVPTLTLSVRHPMTHLLPCDVHLCCYRWGLTDTSITYLLDEIVCMSLHSCTPPAQKSCGSDCIIRNQKSDWTLHWILHLVQICSVISSSWYMDHIFVGFL